MAPGDSPAGTTNEDGLSVRAITVGTSAFGVVGVVSATADWGVHDGALFVGIAVAVAFLAELVVIESGLLEHEMRPQVAGVPLAALCGWAGATAFAYQLALTFGEALPAWLPAPVLAGVLATLGDALVDSRAVEAGAWTYPDHPLSAPRIGEVPWWNYAGWLLVTALVTWLAGALGIP